MASQLERNNTAALALLGVLMLAAFMAGGCQRMHSAVSRGPAVSGFSLETSAVDAFVFLTEETLGDTGSNQVTIGDLVLPFDARTYPIVIAGKSYDHANGTAFFVTVKDGKHIVEQVSPPMDRGQIDRLIQRCSKATSLTEMRTEIRR